MKRKLTLAVACILAAFTAQAQNSDQDNFKPSEGAKTLETSIWFYGDYSGNIKLRKFKNEALAYRHNISATFSRSRISEDGVMSGFTVRYAPGIEKHFSGTNRLSPYIGFEVPLTLKNSHYQDDELEIYHATGYSGDHSYEKAYYGIGLKGLGGVDYYLAKRFYVGIEAGFGINYQKFRNTKIYQNSSTMPTKTIDGFGNTSLSTFTSGIRVGFVF